MHLMDKTKNEKLSQCGYIAIIGRPNVGKSTLLNLLMGKKISITSDKPQTTRYQILGIKTIGEIQAIFIDTPGIHTTEKYAINRYMNRLATSVIPDADVVVWMIEATSFQKDDELVLNKLKKATCPVFLAINKIDKLKNKTKILSIIEQLKEKYNFAAIIPISATKSNNIAELEKEIMQRLPAGPHLFPDEQVTDKNERFQIAELIREKIIRATGQEVPYSSTVEIEEVKIENKLIRVNAIIWVERNSQKPIIIGKDGERLKKIGTYARKDMEILLGKKIFLRLWVKVKDNWTDDERILHNLGLE